jgi:hypothetical protein
MMKYSLRNSVFLVRYSAVYKNSSIEIRFETVQQSISTDISLAPCAVKKNPAA